jgi:hypothetical protein
MKTISTAIIAALLLSSLPARAGTPIINLTVGGEISPGVYGQVQFGNGPPPAVINAQPMLVVPAPQGATVEPMYLHVPPGHAKHWSRYCHRYNACKRPVYFVKSGRYQPNYRDRHHDEYRDEGRHDQGDRGHDRSDESRDHGDRGVRGDRGERGDRGDFGDRGDRGD